MNYRNITPVALAGAAAVAGLLVGRLLGPHSAPGVAPPPTQAAAAPKSVGSSPPPATDVVTLTAAQAKAVSTAPVGTHTFVDLRTAVGMIDFDQNTMVPALSNYAGKIIKVWVDVGDSVKAGQVLYSVDSADLLQAETALVAAAGTYQVTTAALERATALHTTGGFSQKDLDQALADQHTADTALQAARATVRVFGKSEQEIDRVVKTRKADSALLVLSPVSGRVIMRAAQPGLYVLNMSKAQRKGRIFLDYLRNDRMSTAVAPLSPRARPGAPVSFPLTWAQVKKGLDPGRFTLRTAPALLKDTTAWRDYFESERPLREAIRRLGS